MTQARPSSMLRRQAVLAAALDCFTEADVAAVSIADICARSNTSVGSVYHHFGSKEAIVVALIADGLTAHVHALERALEEARDDARKSIAAVVVSLIHWIEANPGWAMFIYANLHSSGAASAKPIRSVNRRYGKLIAGHFSPLIEAGTMRDIPRECWSSLIAAPIHDYARRWLRGQVKPSPSARQKVFVDAAWNIVRAD